MGGDCNPSDLTGCAVSIGEAMNSHSSDCLGYLNCTECVMLADGRSDLLSIGIV